MNTNAPDCAIQIGRCLAEDDWDQAIRLGLMTYQLCDELTANTSPLTAELNHRLRVAQQHFQQTWAARERHRRRLRRLQRLAQYTQLACTSHLRGQSLPPLAQALLVKAKAKAKRFADQ